MAPDHEEPERSESRIGSKRKAEKAERRQLKERLEAEWLAFPTLPGKHLSMRKARRRIHSYELVDDDSGAVLATCRHPFYSVFLDSITSQGRSYRWQTIHKRRLMVAETRVLDLVDVASRRPVMRLDGRHALGVASTTLTLAGRGPMYFPVRGYPGSALMSAEDEYGDNLMEFRLVRSKRRSPFDLLGWTEVVVNPSVHRHQDFYFVIPVARTFMYTYFDHQWAGGG